MDGALLLIFRLGLREADQHWRLKFFFFFNDTATTEIYTLSLHDALPICYRRFRRGSVEAHSRPQGLGRGRSEEHTSELQSRPHLVCRLLLEKKSDSLIEDIRSQTFRYGTFATPVCLSTQCPPRATSRPFT